MKTNSVLLLVIVLLQLISVLLAIEAADPNADTTTTTTTTTTNDAADLDADWGPPIYAKYIVVGGGAAGAVAATRLAQSGASVLLLDGGGPSQSSVGGTDFVAASYTIEQPGKAKFNRPLTRYDVPTFTFSAVPDFPNSPTPHYDLITSYAGAINTTAKILGGNSVHNYMIWDRLTPHSLSTWNVSGWTYNDCLPFWKRSENVSGLGLPSPQYHGFNGPIKLNYPQAPDPAGQKWIQSCANAGLGNTVDFNNPVNYSGCGVPQFNINDRGVRASSVNEYLAPNLDLPNLRVVLYATVIKVLFNTSCSPPEVRGVRYVINGRKYTAYASKEVVLSAGTWNTPKILLLSGLGPAADLNNLGIPVIANLPVGKRMSLHPVVFALYKYNVTSYNPYDVNDFGVEYATKGTGIFATTGTPASSKLRSKPGLPDIDINAQLAFGGYSTPGIVQFAALLWGSKQNNGTITITSSDYRVPAYFDYEAFANQDDLEALVNTIKIFRRIADAYPGNVTFGEETTPGRGVSTDAQLRNYITNQGGAFPTITHLHGGAVLGNYGDNNAVLDPRMRVRKVKGLRVADLSIVPAFFIGGPMANAVMFGERVSDFILADNA